MDETRATARLPHLDIEIVHRQLPEERAEQLAISLRASPSFDAWARAADLQAALWPWLALNPLFAWQRLLLSVWQPWLDQQRVALARQRPARDG